MSQTTFRFHCFKDLLYGLGRLDAICAFLHIAESRLLETMAEQEGPATWLSSAGHDMGIVIDHVDKTEMPTRLAGVFILAVFTHLVEFIEAVTDEHPRSHTWQRKQEEHSIDFLLRNLGMLYAKGCKNEREVVKYYWLVRNRLMHPGVKLKTVENQRKQVQTLLGVADGSAPHKYGELTYSDFCLFTRSVKSLAEKICTMGRPEDVQIAEMLGRDGHRGFRRYKNNERRFRNAVSQQLRMLYNLERSEAGRVSQLLWGR